MVMEKYFEGLFFTQCNENFGDIIDKIPRCITSERRATLDFKVTDREIMNAFGHMDPKKAPGIDGISSLFYKGKLGCCR